MHWQCLEIVDPSNQLFMHWSLKRLKNLSIKAPFLMTKCPNLQEEEVAKSSPKSRRANIKGRSIYLRHLAWLEKRLMRPKKIQVNSQTSLPIQFLHVSSTKNQKWKVLRSLVTIKQLVSNSVQRPSILSLKWCAWSLSLFQNKKTKANSHNQLRIWSRDSTSLYLVSTTSNHTLPLSLCPKMKSIWSSKDSWMNWGRENNQSLRVRNEF